MAGNRDTLGEFNIKVKVDGKTQVRADINAIRAGLKSLNDDLKKASESGKSLSDVLKALKGVKVGGVSGGGTGGKSLFRQVADEAKAAAKNIEKMNDAVKSAKDAVRGEVRAVGRAESAFDRLVGGVKRDAAGNIVGRTGLAGVGYDLGVFGQQLRRGGTNIYSTFNRLIGGERRNAAGEVIGHTGARGVTHSFNEVARAARRAARELAKINGGNGGGGGNPNNPPPGQSWLERLYRGMRTKGQGFESASRMIRGLNVGNAGMINKLSSATSILGRIAGAFTGPAGIFTGPAALVSAWYGMASTRATEGKKLSSAAWARGARLSSAGLDADKVDRLARGNLIAYGAITDEDSARDAYNTAYSDAAGGMERMNTDLALFQTRGIEAPWMAALASQGVDYTTIRSHEDFINTAARLKDSLSKEQWLTFRREAGGALSENEWNLVSRGEYGLAQARYATENLKEGMGSKKHIQIGERSAVASMRLGSSAEDFANSVKSDALSIKTATNTYVNNLKTAGATIEKIWLEAEEAVLIGNKTLYELNAAADPEHQKVLKDKEHKGLYDTAYDLKVKELDVRIDAAKRFGGEESVEELMDPRRLQNRINAARRIIEAEDLYNEAERRRKAREDEIRTVPKEVTFNINGAGDPRAVAEEVYVKLKSTEYVQIADAMREWRA